jgi:hypothetical protein
MKKIARLLKADLSESSDLASIASMLASKGRGRDTLLAHITPREAKILKAAGGSGTTNPETGLLEFEDSGDFDIGFGPGVYSPPDTGPAPEMPTNAQLEAQFYPQTYAQTTQAEDASFAGGPRETGGQPITAGPLAGATVYGPTGTPYTAKDLNRISVGTPTVDQPLKVAPPPQEKSFFDKISSADMVRLGLSGGLGVYGAQQNRKAAEQAQQAALEQKAVGAPYQAKGQELIRAAEAGELTPTGAQSLQALQARLAQGVESRGGVGAQQAAAQAEAYRQQLLSQQYNLGLQVSNIGDQIALGAIRTGLQADQALNQASANFYTNLAMIGAGVPLRTA